jgi:hypothetical protein
MSAPSRQYEIRKRRARRRKVAILRRRYKDAGTETERGRILGQLARLSSTMTLEQFTHRQKSSE